MTNEDIQALVTALKPVIMETVREELKPINERLDNIEEETKIARYVSEELMKWVEINFSHKYPFPIDKDIDVG